MVIRIAWVDSSGNIKQLFTPADFSPYAEGQEQEGLTLQYCGDGITPDSHYWDNGWHAKPAKPGDYYDWVSGAWVLNSDVLLSIIRLNRDTKLIESDWTVMPDSPLTPAKIEEWATYRQALRDFPATNSNAVDLDSLIWPLKPS
ncbi:tail fiber assembly protein [Planktomarina sp.]|uniref:tail fiber assembly protein n=1 Tax=Planktomarina sp. TaxID=2024851 RepID=UPI0032604BC7